MDIMITLPSFKIVHSFRPKHFLDSVDKRIKAHLHGISYLSVMNQNGFNKMREFFDSATCIVRESNPHL